MYHRPQVVLIGNYPLDQQTSMRRYADLLVEHLPNHGFQVCLMRPAPVLGRFSGRSIGVRKWLAYADKFVLFPNVLRRRLRSLRGNPVRRVVTHVCDHSNSLYIRRLPGLPHLVTCHDLLAVQSARGEVWENPTRWSGQKLQHWIVRGLERAQKVACVSEATRAELLRLTRVSSEHASVVRNGLNYPYSPMPVDSALTRVAHLLQGTGCEPVNLPASLENGYETKRFLLHVGSNVWYKNRIGVLRIYAEVCKLDVQCPLLVMAGAPFTSEMNGFLVQQGLHRKVVSLVDIDCEDLRALYSAAELLLFPSLAEGFGWPIIEAQACGCRVVSTNRAPMTEAGGDGAIYGDPRDTAAMARLVEQFLHESDELRMNRLRSGFVNAARFSAGSMASNYAELYGRLLN